MILKMRRFVRILIFTISAGSITYLASCRHELPPLDDDETVAPVDTMVVEPPDTIAGIVCSPDTIHFEWEVLPILKSSCGRRDCHDAGAASSGVKLVNYQTIMQTGGIKPYNPEETRIFKQITHTDEEERMPPPPYDRLSERQVQIIEAWINQGAQNFRCDSATIPCDTDSISFSSDIAPLVKDACYGCHNQYVHEGGIELLDYEDIQAAALNGSLYGTVAGESGYVRMPFGSIQLPACSIEQVRLWVEAGAPEN